MLALAHHIADIAEDKEITGHSARETAGIVSISRHESGGKAAGKMRRGVFFGNRLVHALPEIVGERNVLGLGEVDKACREARIMRGQCGFDLAGYYVLVIPQSRTDLK